MCTAPKKQYIALTQDERKFFMADKSYYDSCQKTIYHTICENTEPIHKIVTTTSCECLMLTRPSMKILHQSDIKIKTGHWVYCNHVPSLTAWIYSVKNPETISIPCKKEKAVKRDIMNSGILRLSAGCTAITEHKTLIGTQINLNSEEFINNPGFALKISKIPPIIHGTMSISKIKLFLWEKRKMNILNSTH